MHSKIVAYWILSVAMHQHVTTQCIITVTL